MTEADDRCWPVDCRFWVLEVVACMPYFAWDLVAAMTEARDNSWSVGCRFWVLEVVARMPYFAYISMLHLYESLGWWRAGAELRRVSTCVCVSLSVCLFVCLCLAVCGLVGPLALLMSMCTCVTCRLSACLSVCLLVCVCSRRWVAKVISGDGQAVPQSPFLSVCICVRCRLLCWDMGTACLFAHTTSI